MALIELWKKSKKELEGKSVQQLITFAGDGKLRDLGNASKEFRDFLANVPSNFISRYAEYCLTNKFDAGGFVLQDVINEVGVRLGFSVLRGRYRGIKREIGYDGLWVSPDKNSIIVEVKTSDTYRIDLETIAKYRRKLIEEGQTKETHSSILLVVGRSDTGDLEAQVRGSRHAWDIRLISVDGLLRLMHLKEVLDDPKIMDKVRKVLMPQEFTKVDGIIDLVFSTAEDVNKEDMSEVAEVEAVDGLKMKYLSSVFREACVDRVQKHLNQTLVKRSYAVYSSPDGDYTVVCINSREYTKTNNTVYWFAFHPHQRELLENCTKSFVALGCGSAETILLVPGTVFLTWLERFNITERDGRMYWHVKLTKNKNEFSLQVKKGCDSVGLNKFLIKR